MLVYISHHFPNINIDVTMCIDSKGEDDCKLRAYEACPTNVSSFQEHRRCINESLSLSPAKHLRIISVAIV